MKSLNHWDMSGNRILNLTDAVNPQDAVTKAQLDAAVAGLKWKDPVRAATTANVVLSGLQTIDAVAIAAGDRVLVKSQATAIDNGVYVAGVGAWVRANDFDGASELLGAAVFVSEGSTHGNQQWQLTTDAPITVGTTPLTFQQFGGGASYTAGNGVLINAGVITLDPAVAARKAGATIGDNVTTAFTVVHNLNTQDVIVGVREASGSKNAVLVDWAIVDNNTVSLSFVTAPSVGQYRVFVLG